MLKLYGIIFVIHFNSYYFDPCSDGICLAIEGYEVPEETVVCPTLQCVEESLNENGIKHLDKVLKITYNDSSAQVNTISVESRLTLKEVND